MLKYHFEISPEKVRVEQVNKTTVNKEWYYVGGVQRTEVFCWYSNGVVFATEGLECCEALVAIGSRLLKSVTAAAK
jgi:hypothetical protein